MRAPYETRSAAPNSVTLSSGGRSSWACSGRRTASGTWRAEAIEMAWAVVVGTFVVAMLWGLVASRTNIPIKASPPRALRLTAVDGIDLAALERFSQELERLGFEPLVECELPHLQSKVLRIYFRVFASPDRTRLGTVNAMLQRSKCVTFVSFDTWFTDDKQLTT